MTPRDILNVVRPLAALHPFSAALFAIGEALAGAGDAWRDGATLVHTVIEVWRREDSAGRAHMLAGWEERIARSFADYRVRAVAEWEARRAPQPRDTEPSPAPQNIYDDELSALDPGRKR